MIVAQLVRAPDCGSGGRRFESGLSPLKLSLGKAFLFPPSLRIQSIISVLTLLYIYGDSIPQYPTGPLLLQIVQQAIPLYQPKVLGHKKRLENPSDPYTQSNLNCFTGLDDPVIIGWYKQHPDYYTTYFFE